MTRMTIAEKILAAHSGNDVVRPGQLIECDLDVVLANDVTAPGAGFDVDTNIVTFVTADKQETLPCLPKTQVAEELLDRAMILYRSN